MFGLRSRKRRELVASVPSWWHSIDLGDGLITPGSKGSDAPGGGRAHMEAELKALELPDLRGKSVLDIGAWDGFYAFAAERLGASRVVALDYHSWLGGAELASIDRNRPPGRVGFDVAHELLGSRVEPVLGDLMEVDVDALGSFDVVLFLGVLYHLTDPVAGMRRVAALTNEVAVVETEAMTVPSQDESALLRFFPGDELYGDPTNWFVPNLAGLEALCTAAGFSRTDRVNGPPPLEPEAGLTHYRAIVHAHK